MRFLSPPRMLIVGLNSFHLKFIVMMESDEPDPITGRSSTIYRVDGSVPAPQREDKAVVMREVQRAFNRLFDSMTHKEDK